MTKKIISPNDSELFRQAVGDVRTVKSDKVRLKQAVAKPYPKVKSLDLDDVWHKGSDFEIDNVSHEETLSFCAPGIQNSILAKLRKGFFGAQAELDLHGLNGETAKQELLQFLHYSVASGYRCVQIIHGKGYRSSDSHPVLKNNINRWLRQHKDVQAFCSALPKHGGAGAVYVLLKVSREHPDKFD
jgi:DNA-nicking Smr family endonuclease